MHRLQLRPLLVRPVLGLLSEPSACPCLLKRIRSPLSQCRCPLKRAYTFAMTLVLALHPHPRLLSRLLLGYPISASIASCGSLARRRFTPKPRPLHPVAPLRCLILPRLGPPGSARQLPPLEAPERQPPPRPPDVAAFLMPLRMTCSAGRSSSCTTALRMSSRVVGARHWHWLRGRREAE